MYLTFCTLLMCFTFLPFFVSHDVFAALNSLGTARLVPLLQFYGLESNGALAAKRNALKKEIGLRSEWVN